MRSLIGAGLLLLISLPSHAQLHGQPYVSGALGASIVGSLSAGPNVRFDTEIGPAATVALGWDFGSGFRTEIEGNYRSNGLSNIETLRANGQLEPLANQSGSLHTYGALANVFYDIDPQLLPSDLKPAIRHMSAPASATPGSTLAARTGTRSPLFSFLATTPLPGRL